MLFDAEDQEQRDRPTTSSPLLHSKHYDIYNRRNDSHRVFPIYLSKSTMIEFLLSAERATPKELNSNSRVDRNNWKMFSRSNKPVTLADHDYHNYRTTMLFAVLRSHIEKKGRARKGKTI